MLGHLCVHPVTEPSTGCRIKWMPSQVLDNFPLVVTFGIVPRSPGQRSQRREGKLPTEKLEGQKGKMGDGGQESPVLAQDTELYRKATEVLRAAVGQNETDILLRQCPIERQLLVRRMRWQGDSGLHGRRPQDTRSDKGLSHGRH